MNRELSEYDTKAEEELRVNMSRGGVSVTYNGEVTLL